MWLYRLLEMDLLPDAIIRFGIRRLLCQKIKEESTGGVEQQQERLMAFVKELKESPIAIETTAANTQHYEVPTDFFKLVLGPHLKYSCAFWNDSAQTLEQAEAEMLKLTCLRADIQDGQDILELGCGWGSLSLWLAWHYPNAKITSVSNSKTQKAWIDQQSEQRGIKNLTVITANMVEFDIQQQFDRVVSVEMFEHMKNYQRLFEKVSHWLKPSGKLFVHVFSHKTFAYHYEDKDGSDWLTRHFFSGGTMPCNDLFLYFQDDLKILEHWVVNGCHYQKTANAWFNNMLAYRNKIHPILSSTYGAENVKKWWVYWKVFFLSCAELWGFKNGQEWYVSHYLFEPRASLKH
ncbi:MAG: cyclopropane-fatty-acyl-phospholipid synthase family protein [Vampirovibrionales bacterium]|nr:cyclopropane-fatty-acyl-phospholipid synthase family protein [Vampirovibrionales bacterium]